MNSNHARSGQSFFSLDAISDAEEIEEHVARVLQSPPFVRAPRMQQFLAFVVEETLAGKASGLKEYNIAVSVFDKPSDFDPGTSAVIRVEAGRLRRLLKKYREKYGRSDRIVLEIPKGSYVPAFVRVEDFNDRAAIDSSRSVPEVEPDRSRYPWPTAEERRTITVVSCALGDEAHASHHSISGKFLNVYDNFLSKCSEIVAGHGGTVDSSASDRLLFYFGWPGALEDSAGRAFTASLHVLEAVKEICSTGPYGIRIGIATGEVIIRDADPREVARKPLVIGEEPALATRILSMAPLNAILVAESARRSAPASSYEFIAAGTVERQAGEPELLWRLLNVRPTVTRFRATHTVTESAIIGRREELALLMSRWRLSLEGEGQGVAIVGEAGIGKSRLSEAVMQQIGLDGAQIRVQCSPHHSNSTLHPVVEFLNQYLEALPTAQKCYERRVRVFLRVFRLFKPLDRAVLQSLLNRVDVPSLTQLSASQQKDLTLKLLTRAMSAQIARHPTVLLVEDVHWADPTTLELLPEVLRLAEKSRLLVILTSRDDLGPDFARLTNIAAIRLTRLPKSESNALVDRVLSTVSLPPTTRALILARAEGIPLFLEELTRLFLATSESRLGAPAVPESLDGLLASQLARLGPSRGIAQLASVIGRQFSIEMLAPASNCEADEIGPAIDQLVAAGIVVRQSSDEPVTYAFRHALLRDAAYESILDEPRRKMHERVGRMLIDSFPELTKEQPEIVAGHLRDAGDHDAAIPYWMSAGRNAAARYALTEAIRDFRFAVDALKAQPDSREHRKRELEVLRELGLVIRSARGYGDKELANIFGRARALAEELQDQEGLANAIYGLWTHAAGRGNWKVATVLASEFERLSRRFEGDRQIEVEAFRLLGASAAFTGEFSAARERFEHALSIFDPKVHGPGFGFDPGAASAAYLSWVNWHLGDVEGANAWAVKALAVAESSRHAPTLAMVLSWLIFYSACKGDVEAIVSLNARLQSVCTERECRYWQPFGAACAEWAAFQSDADVRHLQYLLEHAEGFRERYLTSCLLLLGADICRQARLTEQGLALIRDAHAFIEAHDERVWEAECCRLEAELELIGEDPDVPAATALYRSAIRLARHQKATSLELKARQSLERCEARFSA